MKDIVGVSWQHPMVKAGLAIIDLADLAVRSVNGLASLPPYSVRIRSRGIEGMFGGKKTVAHSEDFRRLLVERVFLGGDSNLLDVGCGCGLTALSLVDVLENGRYTGVDVDRVSVAAALQNKTLAERRFTFQVIDVASDVYTGGDQSAAFFTFPFSDKLFSHIVLASVFTHLQPEEMRNYLQEFGRLLAPRRMATIFDFPHRPRGRKRSLRFSARLRGLRFGGFESPFQSSCLCIKHF
jgi:cyclopropane fatty-acyl-phospholipid synthase-like methyltransferase